MRCLDLQILVCMSVSPSVLLPIQESAAIHLPRQREAREAPSDEGALVNKNWTRKIKNWTVKRGIYSTVHLTMSLGQREFGQERQAYVTRLPDMPDKAITPPTHCKAAFAA